MKLVSTNDHLTAEGLDLIIKIKEEMTTNRKL